MGPSAGAAELLFRRAVRRDLTRWCELALEPQGLRPARHHRLIIRELEAVARGECDRLFLALPPGSAKSTFASDLFPPWWLAQAPDRQIIAASNTTRLAQAFSRRVRGRVQLHGPLLGYGLDREAADLWTTTHGGQYLAVGVGSAVSGFRASLGLVDDAVKSREEADSPVMRDRAWDWYNDDFLTRLKPGAPICMIGTRWHADDLYGRVLKREGARWRVLRIPAMADRPDDPLGRKAGEYLWGDDAYGYAELLRQAHRTALPRTWSSLYQQSPTVEEGAILRRDWWRPWTVPAPERPDMVIVSVDTAFGASEASDPTACTVWHVTGHETLRNALAAEAVRQAGGIDAAGGMLRQVGQPGQVRTIALLRGGWAENLAFPELITALLRTIKECRPRTADGKRVRVPIRLLIENKANGISVQQELRRRLLDTADADVQVLLVDPKGQDKVARAHAVSSLLESGCVWAMAAPPEEPGQPPTFKPFAASVIDEAAAFPNGEHDDRVDSVTQALRHMRDLGLAFHVEEDVPQLPGSRPKF